MPFLAERRKYQRCDCIVCKVQMSADEIHWSTIDHVDISAGGISFNSHTQFDLDKKLFFDIYVYNMLSEFNIKMEGKIIRVDSSKAKKHYSVKFENVNKYQQIQLDELVKSKITLCERKDEQVFEEEYSVFLFPRLRPKIHKINIRNYK